MRFNVAEMMYREWGAYPTPEQCLACERRVEANSPHLFVRDSDPTLSDETAMVGLLHRDCEQLYIDRAKASGIHPPDDGGAQAP